MFFRVVTERFLMCLVIFAFAVSDGRPSLETRLIVFRISHLTLGPCLCSILRISLPHVIEIISAC